MTPLEELQAAYAQLSDLRERAAHGPLGQLNVEDVDLIVTLHRTIDAQLAGLKHGIMVEQRRWPNDTQNLRIARKHWLPLARAINGGAP